MRKLAYSLIVLFAIVISVGFYFGWFAVSAERHGDNNETFTLRFDINSGKIASTREAVAEKAAQVEHNIKEKVGSATSGAETVNGTVAKVEPSAKRLVLTTAGDKALTLVVQAGTKVRLRDAEVGLDALREGDHVTATYDLKDGQNVARSVTVAPPT